MLCQILTGANDDRILGFTMIGSEAGEVMAVVQTAIIAALPYPRLRDAVLTHPTMAEGLGFLLASDRGEAKKKRPRLNEKTARSVKVVAGNSQPALFAPCGGPDPPSEPQLMGRLKVRTGPRKKSFSPDRFDCLQVILKQLHERVAPQCGCANPTNMAMTAVWYGDNQRIRNRFAAR